MLPEQKILELLRPFVGSLELTARALAQISEYLELLTRWNARVSLTAIRSPSEIVCRHFGESLFTAAKLRDRLGPGTELLDFGSGAGFPGLPIQIALPEIRVTVAESQTKKVAFLREVVRTLGLEAEIWFKRVEEMPPTRQFNVVTMRAVDRMPAMEMLAEARVQRGGWLVRLVGGDQKVTQGEVWAVPESDRRWLVVESVPRGTQP